MKDYVFDSVIESIESNISRESKKGGFTYIHRLTFNDEIDIKSFYRCVNRVCRYFSIKGYFVYLDREKVENGDDCIVMKMSKYNV